MARVLLLLESIVRLVKKAERYPEALLKLFLLDMYYQCDSIGGEGEGD